MHSLKRFNGVTWPASFGSSPVNDGLAIEDGARRDVREFNVQEGAVYAALASMLASSCPGLVAHDRPEVIASFGDSTPRRPVGCRRGSAASVCDAA